MDNADIIKELYGCFARGDIDSLVTGLDENVEWICPGPPEDSAAGTWRGRDGVREFFSTVARLWEFERFEPREFVASGDQVAVSGHYKAKFKSTGGVVDSPWVMMWRLRDGKVTHYREFTDTAAVEAAVKPRTASA